MESGQSISQSGDGETGSEGTWTVCRGRYGGHPFFGRFDLDYRSPDRRAPFPVQIGIAVP